MGSLTKYVSDDRPEFAVFIEDDDKVCYAYLWKEGELYNVAPTPSEPELQIEENHPFLNSAEFVSENLKPFDACAPVEVTWDFGEEIVAKIFLSERLIAKLIVGTSPGWSSLVTKDGPLAQKM
ncbi:hypothetical protein K2F45_11390 [Sphingobacterium siyangense]|uniref:hypothetical protein n=1 Tax=Sphingobacterium TaxID=28453 RepID=UPI0009589C3E|nr:MULTISPECIES: hypothetical protein [Sphingobacterium]APU97127.1 hypothetical protein BV902_12850 [Sphingobacterium sp. B29]UQA77539.1 hypothetical protein K2F45_11390 [Sphingobacterium siyangense]